MKNWIPITAVSIAGLLMVAILSWRTTQINDPEKDRPAIYASVVRFYVNKAVKAKYKVLFLEIEGKDPAPEFMKRFQTSPVSVRKWSRTGNTFQAGKWTRPKKSDPGWGSDIVYSGDTAHDISTGEQGLPVRLGDIGRYTATVDGQPVPLCVQVHAPELGGLFVFSKMESGVVPVPGWPVKDSSQGVNAAVSFVAIENAIKLLTCLPSNISVTLIPS